MGRMKPTVCVEEMPQQEGGPGGKSKKQNIVIDDVYPIGTELSEEFTGAQLKGRKKPPKASFELENEDYDGGEDGKRDEKDDEPVVSFKGKKKSSKRSKMGGSNATFALLEEEENARDENAQSEVVDKISKKKKKKKQKSGRTAEEEEDLDKILAELGGPPQDEKIDTQLEPIDLSEVTGEREGEGEGIAESAAATKKRKKKEKEKEKKENEKNMKEEVKKVAKHVREKQEILARRREEEERKKREEDERLREEEEERRRQEEAERQAEEDRLKKKEMKKLNKKKQEEGNKLLLTTGKQKEEQRRYGVSLPALDNDCAPKKRPIYTTKKPRHDHVAKIPCMDEEENKLDTLVDFETEEVKVVGTMDVEEKTDDDEEWDAKSWDDTNLSLPVKKAFDDEDINPVAQKTVQSVVVHETPKPSSAVKAKVEDAAEKKKASEEVKVKMETQSSDTQTKETEGNLRSPICCIMGHVDTGKTKLLDCIRGTNVQKGEAGGITQQIGATYFPADNIIQRTKKWCKADVNMNVPGLLVIDTPGHESFANLRSRGSGLCDIAILVVDIMHGLEKQTIESLNLLKMRNTKFIVALNKVDRLYGWEPCPNAPIQEAMKEQKEYVQEEFKKKLRNIKMQFMEQGLNTELYYENTKKRKTISIVPTSAVSGEGIPDLLLLLVKWTEKTMVEKLTFSNGVQCTVLEVKVVEGHGTTIDVVLVNGVLHEGDQIVVCGMQGPIVTTIRALLTPHPMKELRVKGTYLHHKEIKGAQCIKLTAQGLEHAVAGTSLYVVGPDDDLQEIKKSVMEDMESVLSRIDKSGEGVCVHASTLGSLEALLEFLKSPAVNIPVSGLSIGPVHKKDVMKASVMLEKKKEYATILVFDVKVMPEAREYAHEAGVNIFIADIIYHLFKQFSEYIDNIKKEKKREAAELAVFPCVLKIMPDCVFNKKDPILLGVVVRHGIVKVGTPICIPSKEFADIGRIASIQKDKKPVDFAKKGDEVAIKIVGSNHEEQQKMYGRHFDEEDELVSRISRESIDVLKANFQGDLSLSTEEWNLVRKLKKLFNIC